jgi:hypothetical protein
MTNLKANSKQELPPSLLPGFEQGSDKPTLLKANYLYDPASNQWAIYANKNSK